MFVMGNLLEATAMILGKVLGLYSVVIMLSVLISWVSPDPFNPIVRFLRSMTEPLFASIRRVMPFVVVGMIDLSPIVAILLMQLAQMVVVRSLFDLAARFR